MANLKKIKCCEVFPASIKTPCKQFTSGLKKQRKSMRITDKDKCEVVIFYLPIVSRAGTDIQGAMKKIDDEYKGKYVALVVLHHTFDPESIVPDSNRAVNTNSNEKPEKLFVVDCLFHEDNGLLKCRKNTDSGEKVASWLHAVKHNKTAKGKVSRKDGSVKQRHEKEKDMKKRKT